MKHIIAFLCALILALSVPAAVCAAEEIYTEGTLYYTVGDETINIVGCFGRKTEVTVPSSIAGYPVNTISKGAFTDNKYIMKLNLPDTVTTIESGAIADGIKVIYNANTDHPQEEVPDIITGREPILVPADTDETKSKQTDNRSATSASTEASAKSGSAGDLVLEGDVDGDDSNNGGGSSSGSNSGSKTGTNSGSKTTETTSKSSAFGSSVSEASGSSSSTASAEKGSVSASAADDASVSADAASAKPSSADGATPDESGGGNGWLIIILVIAGVAAAGIAFYMFRKKKMKADNDS